MRKLIFLTLSITTLLFASCRQETLVVGAIKIGSAEFYESVYNPHELVKKWNKKGERPMIIDFYATWCPPCRTVEAYLEEFAVEYNGRVDIYRVNANDERELARELNIEATPTLLFIPLNGEPEMIVGAREKEILKSAIESIITRSEETLN